MGCTDEVTAEFISSRTGDITVGVSSEAKQLNSWRVSDYTPEYRQTRSIGKRKLLTPDEILRLPLDTALIILRGQKVLKVEKYDYTLHPDAKKIVSRKASGHIPKWRENGEAAENNFTPKIPSPKRKSKKMPSFPHQSMQTDILYTNNPIYPEPEEESSDILPEDDFWRNDSDTDIVPLDKDSIMS